MKRCPKCGRTFTKDAQKFCTHDGGTLVPSAIDPNATVAGETPDPTAPGAPEPDTMEAPTRTISRDVVPPSSRPLDPYATMVGVKPLPEDPGPADTVPTHQDTSPGPARVSAPMSRPPSEPLPPAVSAQLPPPAAPPPAPLFAPPSPPPARKSKMPFILAVLAILLLMGLGGIAAGYFFYVRPMLEARKRPIQVVLDEVNQNANTNVDVSTPSPDNSANSNFETEQPSFVPPANAVEFVNSNANLDGKLAEHYLDFSFYYPKSWRKDPQAGVPGSGDFVKVERRLPPDFTQENFTVGWYVSGGSLGVDRQLFPNFIEALSAKFEKGFPGYRKLSEGETKVNTYDAYEFRFQSVSRGTAKGDITLWGRVIFLPPKSGTNGAILLMTATSLAPELSSADDVGVKGDLPIILESFRLGERR